MRPSSLSWIAVAALGVLVAGCKGKNPVAVSDPSAPVIDVLTATPNSIQAGDATVLTWIVKGSLTSLFLDDGRGNAFEVFEKTSLTFHPLLNTTYRLTARNADGSSTATTTVRVASVGGDPGSPPAPKSLQARDENYGNVERFVAIAWSPSPGAASYLIERRSPGESFRQVGVPSNAYGDISTYFEDASLLPATSYFYRVRAVGLSGAKSAYSNETALTTGGTQITVDALQIVPESVPTLDPGATFFMKVNPHLSGGGSFYFTLNPTLYTWNSTNQAVTSVDSFGLLTAGSMGSTQITASLGGVTSNVVTVEVAAPSAASSRTFWRQSVSEYWRRPALRRS